jgi:hypothetical protein
MTVVTAMNHSGDVAVKRPGSSGAVALGKRLALPIGQRIPPAIPAPE